ncbi:hypothetical protein AGR6A_pAt60224 [Agrobacterium sp. NCPPB 925]|nr:hypothetical protein AGR6A_pAt60224 [Agrobacterium sp. NCPPB 925]
MAIRETLVWSGLASDPQTINAAIMGQFVHASARMYPPRQAAIGGGLPLQGPALTVNRVAHQTRAWHLKLRWPHSAQSAKPGIMCTSLAMTFEQFAWGAM